MSRATITAYTWVPDFAKGLVRDLRARWAFEEVGEAYDVRYLDQGQQKKTPHRTLQPFGQVPTLEERGLTLFESGAIVQYIAKTREGLLPADGLARERAIEWMFAALNTIEPPINDLINMMIFEADKPWAAERRTITEETVRDRLGELSARLGDQEWLDGDTFTAGDLLMVTVLRILRATGVVEEHDNLARYRARGEARPAFRRALDAQMAGFTGNPPPGYAEWASKAKQGERA